MPTIFDAFAGSFNYEFRMQIRRRALWISTGLTALLLLGILLRGNLDDLLHPMSGPLQMSAVMIGPISYFLPLVFGILMADRLPRERRLRTIELFESLPVSTGSRLWGKYLGAAAATAIPIFSGYLMLVVIMSIELEALPSIPALFPVFALVVLPGLLFVGAFSIACTEVIPTPLYAILFVGYWFWGNLVSPSRMPTLSCTPLTPAGHYAAIGFFDRPGADCGLGQYVTPIVAAGSIALLVGVGFLAILVVQTYINRRVASR